MVRLDETADLFYDADEPSRSMAGRALWLHDYLKGVLAGELRGPDEERLLCAMFGMTESNYEFLTGTADNVYGDEDSFLRASQMGVAERVLGVIGKFFLMRMRFVARVILVF